MTIHAKHMDLYSSFMMLEWNTQQHLYVYEGDFNVLIGVDGGWIGNSPDLFYSSSEGSNSSGMREVGVPLDLVPTPSSDGGYEPEINSELTIKEVLKKDKALILENTRSLEEVKIPKREVGTYTDNGNNYFNFRDKDGGIVYAGSVIPDEPNLHLEKVAEDKATEANKRVEDIVLKNETN